MTIPVAIRNKKKVIIFFFNNFFHLFFYWFSLLVDDVIIIRLFINTNSYFSYYTLLNYSIIMYNLMISSKFFKRILYIFISL